MPSVTVNCCCLASGRSIMMEKKVNHFESINLELTTKCPLRCPQCYCTLEGGKDLSRETALRVIREAAELGAKHAELSGGETLCYPWLLDLVAEARKNGIVPNIAISGWHFDRHVLDDRYVCHHG